MTENRGRALIALGSNLAHEGLSGAPLLWEAVRHLEAAQFVAHARSSVWESAPWPSGPQTSGQSNYVNAIVACDVGERTPQAVIAQLQEIEWALGRKRRTRWAARTLDLDLIDLNGLAGEFDGVQLPHPRAHERGFVLAPLAEVDPDWRHPILHSSAAELLAALPLDPSLRRLTA